MSFVLEVVCEDLSLARRHIEPQYTSDDRFNPLWWESGSAKSPVSFCRFIDDGEEVARAKVIKSRSAYGAYTTWRPPSRFITEIDLLEVRLDVRRSCMSYGRQAVESIVQNFGAPAIACSLNVASDAFWQKTGWTMHRHPSDRMYRPLFTSA